LARSLPSSRNLSAIAYPRRQQPLAGGASDSAQLNLLTSNPRGFKDIPGLKMVALPRP
jgi:hypothetical protein